MTNLTAAQRALLTTLTLGREYTHEDMRHALRDSASASYSPEAIQEAVRGLCARGLMRSAVVTNGINVFRILTEEAYRCSTATNPA